MRVGGESYLDVKERCHSVLMKLVGSRDSILVIAHAAVIRVIMSYFLDVPGPEIPQIEVKRNHCVRAGTHCLLHPNQGVHV